jgi:hypothetical protein
VFVVRATGISVRVNEPPTVTWLAADGTVLKRLIPPNPATLKKLCLNRPEVCAPYATMSGSSSYGPAAKATGTRGAGRSGTSSK